MMGEVNEKVGNVVDVRVIDSSGISNIVTVKLKYENAALLFVYIKK